MREMAKHLRALSDQVVETYLARRFSWIDAYSRPEPDGIRDYLAVLAESVAHRDPSRYFDYSRAQIDKLLESGMAPIALLAAGDLLQETILELVTPDQREVLWDLLAEERQRRQSYLRDVIIPAERGA